MHRREYLAAVGGMAALAGCSSSGSTGPDAIKASQDGISRSTNGLKVTATDVATSLPVETNEATHTTDDPEISVLIHFKISAEGDSSRDTQIRRDLSLMADTVQETPRAIEGDTLTYPVTGDLYIGSLNARPSVTESGWIAFSFPRDDLDDARLSWQPPTEDEHTWQLGVSSDEVAEFAIGDVNIPREVEYNRPIQLSAEVENVGGAPGRYIGEIRIEEAENQYLRADVESGETQVLEKTISRPEDDITGAPLHSPAVSLEGVSRLVEWVVPGREVGEPYVSPGGLEIVIDDWQTLRYAEYDGWNGEITPDSGEQLLFFKLSVSNGDDMPRTAPHPDSFTLRSEDREFQTETEHPGAFSAEDWIEPDVEVYQREEIDPGNGISGWILLSVTDDVDIEGSRLRWSRDIVWTPGDELNGNTLIADWVL